MSQDRQTPTRATIPMIKPARLFRLGSLPELAPPALRAPLRPQGQLASIPSPTPLNIRPILRSRPDLVSGIPMALDNLAFAPEIPRALFHENDKPSFLPMFVPSVQLPEAITPGGMLTGEAQRVKVLLIPGTGANRPELGPSSLKG